MASTLGSLAPSSTWTLKQLHDKGPCFPHVKQPSCSYDSASVPHFLEIHPADSGLQLAKQSPFIIQEALKSVAGGPKSVGNIYATS